MSQHLHVEKLLQKIIEGSATLQERSLMQKWLFALDISILSEDYLTLDKMNMLRKILDENISTDGYSIKGKNKYYYFFHNSRNIAAIIIGFTLSCVMAIYIINQNKNTRITNTKKQEWVIIQSGNSIKYLTLPDKSKIWLNSHSRLSFEKNKFASENRKIWLEGEAFFEVERDTSSPFIVYSSNLTTKVLGTWFNVASYKEDHDLKVTLIHGKVSVKSDVGNKTIVLLPQEQLSYSKENNDFTIRPYSKNPAISWMEGGLQFDETPLSEALDNISHRFDIKIQYNQHSVKNKKVTASFDSDTSLEMMLKSLLFIHGLDFNIKKNVVYVFID